MPMMRIFFTLLFRNGSRRCGAMIARVRRRAAPVAMGNFLQYARAPHVYARRLLIANGRSEETVSTALSMAAFALATSITPGPVNIVALSAGARYGLRASLRHVT